jgi:DNA invertase Pin-like site-specific DNA recombinase
MKRAAIYLRVSTSKQDTENQRRELEAVGARSSWQIVKVYEDAGVSGAKGRDKRPGLDAMLKAVNAKEFEIVAAWSVDRLGRSLTDLLGILQGLHDKGVDLFLHQQGLDTSTTAGRLGRRPVEPTIEARIRELKAEGMGILKIGRIVGVGTSVVQRVIASVR